MSDPREPAGRAAAGTVGAIERTRTPRSTPCRIFEPPSSLDEHFEIAIGEGRGPYAVDLIAAPADATVVFEVMMTPPAKATGTFRLGAAPPAAPPVVVGTTSVGYFVALPANPVCGPLRSFGCAQGALVGDFDACDADWLAKRANYAALYETFMPPVTDEPVDPAAPCDTTCALRRAVSIAFSVPLMLGLSARHESNPPSTRAALFAHHPHPHGGAPR